MKWRNLVQRKFGTNSQISLQSLGQIPRWWHKKKHRPWMVVAGSFEPLVGCCHVVETSGWLLGWLLSFPGGCGAHWNGACQERSKNET